jgi:dipeptidyl aminopeptidase/acylaminoacyl peptidase
MKLQHLPAAICGILLVAGFGCEDIPCYPPKHFSPPPGAPYGAEHLQVPTQKGHALAGTLTIPSNGSPPYPAVLLITGSSRQNRDHLGNPEKPASLYKPFRQIADVLSRNGMAVLRMDDQGVGCSGGGPFEDVTIPERADDSRAGISYLRSRKDIDGQRVALLGLSEGANIAPMIAASDAAIRAIVLLAPTATNGHEIIKYQRGIKIDERSGLTKEQKEWKLYKSMRGLDQALARGEGSPWFRSFIAYDPLPAAKRVSCPALVLHGDKDSHVPVTHSEMVAHAMRTNGNNDVTVRIFPDHNHLFLKDPIGRISGYADLLWHTNQVSEDVISTIVGWLSDQLHVH